MPAIEESTGRTILVTPQDPSSMLIEPKLGRLVRLRLLGRSGSRSGSRGGGGGGGRDEAGLQALVEAEPDRRRSVLHGSGVGPFSVVDFWPWVQLVDPS